MEKPDYTLQALRSIAREINDKVRDRRISGVIIRDEGWVIREPKTRHPGKGTRWHRKYTDFAATGKVFPEYTDAKEYLEAELYYLEKARIHRFISNWVRENIQSRASVNGLLNAMQDSLLGFDEVSLDEPPNYIHDPMCAMRLLALYDFRIEVEYLQFFIIVDEEEFEIQRNDLYSGDLPLALCQVYVILWLREVLLPPRPPTIDYSKFGWEHSDGRVIGLDDRPRKPLSQLMAESHTAMVKGMLNDAFLAGRASSITDFPRSIN